MIRLNESYAISFRQVRATRLFCCSARQIDLLDCQSNIGTGHLLKFRAD